MKILNDEEIDYIWNYSLTGININLDGQNGKGFGIMGYVYSRFISYW